LAEVDVYAEEHKRLCMAHVLELPGCFVRAGSLPEALERLGDAVESQSRWLRAAGWEPEVEEPVTLIVAEVVGGAGPFDPGDPAAIFSPERLPLPSVEMERWLELLNRSRADLLEVVRRLGEEDLDRVGVEEGFPVRQILRHIGNAEQGYTSKLVESERLPGEWSRDESLPIREFLEMERRDAFAILRSLDDAARAETFVRLKSDGVTKEPWSARKVLRRFLEHEQEHYRQIMDLLGEDRRRA
jgi:uncharacterized damage-inducible protein DinB